MRLVETKRVLCGCLLLPKKCKQNYHKSDALNYSNASVNSIGTDEMTIRDKLFVINLLRLFWRDAGKDMLEHVYEIEGIYS